jgi:hypothetical protein
MQYALRGSSMPKSVMPCFAALPQARHHVADPDSRCRLRFVAACGGNVVIVEGKICGRATVRSCASSSKRMRRAFVDQRTVDVKQDFALFLGDRVQFRFSGTWLRSHDFTLQSWARRLPH